MDVLHALWGLLTEPWALLMLAASFLYAGMNYLDEWLLARLGSNAESEEKSDAVGTLVIISGLFGLVIASMFGVVALLSPHHGTQLNLGRGLTLQAMLVGLFEIAYLIPYLYATKRAGTMEAAPLFQSIPVISLVLGMLFFREMPPVVHIAGSIVIVSGAAILNIVPGTLKLDGRTIGLMLLSSTLVALIYFLFKGAATEGNFIGTAFWSGIGMFLASVLIFVFLTPYRRQFMEFCKTGDKTNIAIQLVNEVADAIAAPTTQLAAVLGPSVMVVSALSAYQPVFILIIGWVLAKNGSRAHADQLRGSEFYKKIIAIALIALGTVLIAL